MPYRIIWDNGHASGDLAGEYNTAEEAAKAARAWKREMVAIERTEKERREARRAYQWEVVEVGEED